MAELSLKELFRIPDNAKEKLANKTFVGIDFGTSTTVVSVASFNTDEKRIECSTLHLQQKLRDGAIMTGELLPSVIAIGSNGGFLVGQGAYELKGNPEYISGKNIWHSFKMKLGENMGPQWTSITDHQLIKSPQDATNVFFRYLKGVIEKAIKESNLPEDIHYAVSIPASFESNQRLDLLQALYNNGIDIDGGTLIDEPNAAFISYITPDWTYKEPITIQEAYNPKVLVFDFGAGTCDLSILEMNVDYKGCHTKNISISQFAELGGNDIDRYIAYNFLLPHLLETNGRNPEDYLDKQIDIIANQLLGIAEKLKIKCSRAFRYLLTDEDSLNLAIKNGQVETYEEHVDIYTDYANLIEDSFTLSYKQFMEAMHAFLNNKKLPFPKNIKSQKRYNSIYGALQSAINKAHINKGEVDYVLLVGGSSKNPYVQKCIREYFPDHTKLLIPQDLQSLVSQGAAIHSLLKNGLDTTIINPITSEPIVIVTRGEHEFPVIPAGTEIPFPTIIFSDLSTGENEQDAIEIPICVGSANKVVSNLKIEDPLGIPFPKHTQIELSLEMNVDKVLTIQAKCAGLECNVKSENPFSNTYETDEEKEIREKEKGTYISADENHGRPSRASLEALRQAYLDAGRQYEAAETIVQQLKYYPQDDLYNYIGVLYHNSGNYYKSIRFFEKALSFNRTAWALSNLGHDLYIIGKNDEAKDYLEQALGLKADLFSALSKLGDIFRDLGDEEKAKSYYEQCFNILNRKWKDGTLDEADSTWFEDVAYKLGKNSLAKEIADSRNGKKKHLAFNSENLVTIEKKEEKI